MTEERHFDNDFDEACNRILSAATTALLLHRGRLPEGVQQALQAIAADARFLIELMTENTRPAANDHDPESAP